MGIYGFILVFVGGGLGSALRHGSNLLALRLVGSAYPLGTLAINVLGAFVMEWFALKTSLPQSARLFITTGILGGFTTFSTYALEIGMLYERGDWLASVLYALGSLVLGVAALFAGLGLVRMVAH
jgi:fluoride exporter